MLGIAGIPMRGGGATTIHTGAITAMVMALTGTTITGTVDQTDRSPPRWRLESATPRGVGGSALGRRSAGGGSGDLAEYRARDEAGAARVVEIEQAADQLARRV